MCCFLADTESENMFPRRLTPEVLQALRGVRFIAQHIKDADKDNEVDSNTIINLFSSKKLCLLIGPFLDRSRMEIRFDGFGSLPPVGVHIDLHRWYDWYHF